MPYYMGIDIGGTNIKGVILNHEHTLVAKSCLPSCALEGSEKVCKQIFSIIDQLLTQAKLTSAEIVQIGLGLPGHWNKSKKILSHCSNLPLENVPFVEALEQHYNIPIVVANDASAATWGEYVLGAGQGSTNMLFITVSTGIGAGAIINHKLYTGSSGNALELGHISIEQNGRPCTCGNHGCAEKYASGAAINKAAEYMFFALGSEITTKKIFEAAAEGNSKACFIIRDALYSLGVCVSVAATLFDPDVIVVGGGLVKAGPQVLEAITNGIKERCAKPIVANLQVKASLLGDDAGSYGAALLAKDI